MGAATPSNSEPGARRITRNWDELLQELRVIQTGVQILTGFLLTVPFSSRFSSLTTFQVDVYLAVLCGATLTTALVVSPVAFHRVLFREHKRPWLVKAANTAARSGLVTLALTSSGALFLVFDVTGNTVVSLTALLAALVLFGALWLGVPLLAPGQEHRSPPEG